MRYYTTQISGMDTTHNIHVWVTPVQGLCKAFHLLYLVLKSLPCNISCVSSIILRSDILQRYVRILPDCSHVISSNFSRIYAYRTVTFCVDDRDGDVFAGSSAVD